MYLPAIWHELAKGDMVNVWHDNRSRLGVIMAMHNCSLQVRLCNWHGDLISVDAAEVVPYNWR